MSFLDKAKAKLTDAVDKHGGKIADGIDKAARRGRQEDQGQAPRQDRGRDVQGPRGPRQARRQERRRPRPERPWPGPMTEGLPEDLPDEAIPAYDEQPDPDEYEPDEDTRAVSTRRARSTTSRRARHHPARRRGRRRGRAALSPAPTRTGSSWCPRPTSSSCAAGPTGDTEVLLQLRQNTGYMDGHWAAAAAGHVERGETAYDAAQREAAEELDIATSPWSSSPRCSGPSTPTRSTSGSTSSSPPGRGRASPASSSPPSAPSCGGAASTGSTRCPVRSSRMSARYYLGCELGYVPSYTTFGFAGSPDAAHREGFHA